MKCHGHTVFCDDIRHETNGKLSLIGCYMGTMNVLNSAPTQIPLFSALISLSIPRSLDFEKVKIWVEQETSSSSATIFELTLESNEVRAGLLNGEEALDFIGIQIPCQWSPFSINSDEKVKARAYVDEELVNLGALQIKTAEQPS